MLQVSSKTSWTCVLTSTASLCQPGLAGLPPSTSFLRACKANLCMGCQEDRLWQAVANAGLQAKHRALQQCHHLQPLLGWRAVECMLGRLDILKQGDMMTVA